MDRYPYNSTLYYLRLRVHLRTFRHIVYTPRLRLSVADALSRKTISGLSLKHGTWRFEYDGALLAQLKTTPELRQMMIDAKESDVKLQQSVQLVKNREKTDYSIEDDGSLLYKNGLCVSNVQELKKKMMYESHNTVFTMHLGGNKMYWDLKQYYWWQGMKKDIAEYVSKWLTCQQVKDEHQVLTDLLNLIPIPQWK